MRIRNWARMTGAVAAMALILGGAAMATTTLPVSADISNTCAIGTVTALTSLTTRWSPTQARSRTLRAISR